MQFRQMEYFVAIVESGGFRAAADRLYVSQSAVSQQIRSLEQELGVTLIDRGRGRFELTRAGEHFYVRSRAILNDVRSLEGETRRIGEAADEWTSLNVWYIGGYAGLDIASCVAEFTRRWPAVTIDTRASTHEEMRYALIDGLADMAIMEQRRAFSDNYENRILADAPTLIELPADSPLARADAVSVADLAHLPCVLVSSQEQQSTEADYVKLVYGFAGPYRYAADLAQARMQVVATGGFLLIDGVGTLSPAGKGLVRLPLVRGGRRLTRCFCAFWLKDNINPNMRRFADLLDRAIANAPADQR